MWIQLFVVPLHFSTNDSSSIGNSVKHFDKHFQQYSNYYVKLVYTTFISTLLTTHQNNWTNHGKSQRGKLDFFTPSYNQRQTEMKKDKQHDGYSCFFPASSLPRDVMQGQLFPEFFNSGQFDFERQTPLWLCKKEEMIALTMNHECPLEWVCQERKEKEIEFWCLSIQRHQSVNVSMFMTDWLTALTSHLLSILMLSEWIKNAMSQ